ncbi:acetamidase/formamidase family protein [Pyrococcus yayanosii]|uniref:Acetamidase/Formamidase family n=1 Tax=Pyrococcus yayanosii (strain CH1 / JCM 16557) TaxID=529709 RepID=F8AJ17_PYRYC|nr:acetamidase/formamidase family protein [Pyrococcus yayanosii]AEH24388.1 Acetamidase/Formamidase family [Pyrococcus yayanosii CH1]
MILIPKEKHVYSFGPNMKPVARAKPGDIVVFETIDALGGQIKDESDTIEKIDFSRVNPATGPLYVENAKRGKVLAVEILDIEIAGRGIVVTAPKAGVLGDKVEKPRTRICEIKDGTVHFGNLKIPVKPMIGVIGVAYDEEIPTGTPGRHGGNMDTNLITKGTILYLPVFKEGGLLAIGDLHAVMGDGEVCVSACEVSGRVKVKVDVLDGVLEWPLLETADAYYLLVSMEKLDDAIREGVELGVEALAKANGLEWDDAYMLASLVMDVEISQLVDPAKTIRVRIPKEYVSLEAFFKG